MGTTIFGISKTTLGGIISGLIAILSGVLAYQIPSALLTPQVTHTWLWVTTGGQVMLIVLRGLVGMLQGDAPTGAINLSSKVPLVLIAALVLPMLAGCTDFERQSYKSLAASKAAIDQAQADYESGKLPHSQTVYDAVNKAKAAQTLAVNAMVTYEQMKATGAGQSALTAAQNDVAIAIGQLPAILADIKALYTKASVEHKPFTLAFQGGY